MELIDKDALVAEIERIKKEECPTDTYEGRCKLLWFERFLSFINTLEVKEETVSDDLEESANNYVGHAPEIDEDLSCLIKRNAFIAGAQWRKEQKIDKAFKYINYQLNLPSDFEQHFRKAMEE